LQNTAAGLRYVLYTFLSQLKRPYVITHQPGDIFQARRARSGWETTNVAFSNGWIATRNGAVFIDCGASDRRLNVVTSTVEKFWITP